MSQAVKRACDACHRRKVKCDGTNPCKNCHSAGLGCTYNAIPQKKGPKGSRAKVITELRETQRQTSLSARVQSHINGMPLPTSNTDGLAPTSGLLTAELAKACLNFFFDNMYTQLPILDRTQIEQSVLFMEQNRDSYCLMTSLCAFVMLQTGMTMPAGDPFNLDMMPGANIVASQLLLDECLRVRKGHEYLDSVSHNTLATNFFLFACYYSHELHDRAWYNVREATTMIHMAGMTKEDFYMQLDAADAARRRRLYWLFFSLERSYALQRGRPLTLQATINMPTLGDDPNDPCGHQLTSFISMINLFRPFDDAFLATWNRTNSQLTAPYISDLQKQHSARYQYYLYQDSTTADVSTNQGWLRHTAMNLANRDASEYQYNLSIANDMLLSMASSFTTQTTELINSGMLEKLLEITHATNEYLSIQPENRDPFAVGPHQHLEQLIAFTTVARHGEYTFMPLVMNKLAHVIPRLVDPRLKNAPETTTQQPMANFDMFDGFGTAGMAQPPTQQMHLPVEDYDRKFTVEEYDKQYSMDVVNHTTPESTTTNSNHSGTTNSMAQQSNDLSNNFVSSPAIMSPPAIDYTHNMNGYACTPMSEMVMSPMSQQQQQQQQQHQPAQPQHQQQHLNRTPMNTNGLSSPHPNMNGMYAIRQPPPRQASFHLQNPPQMRTVGDFQGLQRGTNDGMVGMTGMGGEMDFGMQ